MGLQGIRREDTERVESIIRSVLSSVHRHGFPSDRIEGALHSLELSSKHQSAAFGLGLAQSMMKYWLHGVPPMQAVSLKQKIDAFRAEYAQGRLFEKRVEKYLLVENNPHQLLFTMHADADYNARLEQHERRLLEEMRGRLSDKQVAALMEEAQALVKMQHEKEGKKA